MSTKLETHETHAILLNLKLEKQQGSFFLVHESLGGDIDLEISEHLYLLMVKELAGRDLS